MVKTLKIWKKGNTLKFFTSVFVLIISLLSLFQLFYFKYYLDKTVNTKVVNTLNLIETKLFDYVRFLENYYKVPFLPEFAELPESKGWLLDLVDFLEDLFKREKFISLALFYQKDLFLSWNYEESSLPFAKCEDRIVREESKLKAFKLSKIENREYCIYLTLDISYYYQTFIKYSLMVLFFNTLVLVIIFYLYHYAVKSEEKQREIERKLQAERELALLGRMAGTLAHELRNSLNNLFLILQTGFSDHSMQRDYQGKLHGEIKRILDWTQDILLFHKSINLQPTFFSGETLLYDLKLFAATLQSYKTFIFEVKGEIKELWGDSFWLKKALENLIKNAFDAIEKEGVIKITVNRSKDNFVIEIYDNGPPIDPQIQEKIFDPFFTTKKEGFGLGLYLVKKIMEAHHGRIEIENLPEGGKIFRLIWKPL
ncbi:MAG: ATP-binding protein [Caldimicrobium sp.]|nr:ATP-binding protein [Caldimicrobium sp.]MCX7613743.1 ATP-binding protein [Caldimicrobium sp.]MDW8183158.1 ATP-binding protein [Caldimicrobium sp.]